MPQPFQYVAPPSTDLGAAATSGLNLGFGIAQKNFAQQQQQIQVQRQQQMRGDLATLANHGNPTASDYATLVLKYPELKDSFKQGWDMLSSEQQRQRVSNAGPIVNAMNSGRMDLATDMLQQNVDALKNSNGSPEDIRAAEMWLRSAKEAPDALKFKGNMFLASVMGNDYAKTFLDTSTAENANAATPGKIAETASVTAKNNADAAKTNAEIPTIAPRAEAERRNIQSQIDNRAGQLGLDRDKLISETQVKLAELAQKGGAGVQDPDVRKLINDAVTGSVVSANAAGQMRDLANQIDSADPRAFAGGFGERMAALTGQEDYVSQLRKEYTRIRTSEMLRSLPPGPASDRDIENAKSGFISETGSPAQISSWLRGMAKLQDYAAQWEDAKSQWAVANGHLGRAAKDLTIGDIHVAAGTTLTEFAKQALKYPGAAASREAQPKPAAKTNYMDKYGTTPGGAVTGIAVPR